MSRPALVLATVFVACSPTDPGNPGGSPDLGPAICGGMLCNSPPANSCQGPNTLIVYSPTGSCDNATCSYGASAQSCPTGCADGRCVHAPVVLASGQDNPVAVAVDATSVYWANFAAAGSIMKASLTGQNVTTLASARFAQSVAVDATSVYWPTSEGDVQDGPELGSIMKASLSGQNLTTLASGQDSPLGLAVDATSIYWVSANFYRTAGDEHLGMAGTIRKASLSGQNPTVLATGQFGPWRIAVDPTSVYWINLGGSVMKSSLAGQNLTTIASGQQPLGIAVDATSVYWATSDKDSGSVMKASLAGQNITPLVATRAPSAVAVDATNVYWSDNSSGSIMRASLTGQNPTEIASGQKGTMALAVDATSLYWVTRGDSGPADGTVMKIAK